MRWFDWKWWRFARASFSSSYTRWDHDGRWRRVTDTIWFLEKRGAQP